MAAVLLDKELVASSYLRLRPALASSQRMLNGEKTLVGNGYVRDVYLVDSAGESIVLKTLRPVEGRSRQELHLNMHRREVLTLDAVRKSWPDRTRYAGSDQVVSQTARLRPRVSSFERFPLNQVESPSRLASATTLFPRCSKKASNTHIELKNSKQIVPVESCWRTPCAAMGTRSGNQQTSGSEARAVPLLVAVLKYVQAACFTPT